MNEKKPALAGLEYFQIRYPFGKAFPTEIALQSHNVKFTIRASEEEVDPQVSFYDRIATIDGLTSHTKIEKVRKTLQGLTGNSTYFRTDPVDQELTSIELDTTTFSQDIAMPIEESKAIHPIGQITLFDFTTLS